MSHRLLDRGRIIQHIVEAALNDRITFLAASIAFYAILSIFPLILLALVIGSILGGEVFEDLIMRGIGELLAPEARELVHAALQDGSGRSGAGLLSVVFLAWASLRVFRGLDIAFSMVYGRGSDPTFLSSILNASIVLVAISIGFVGMFVVRTAVRFVSPSPLLGILTPLFVLLSLVVAFFPMYFVFPGERQPVRTVVPGTIFAALGWTMLAELFGFYAANAGTYALFGLIGGVLLTFVWFYFAAILLLLGAVINAVLAGRYREPPDPIPEETAIGPGNDVSSERDVGR